MGGWLHQESKKKLMEKEIDLIQLSNSELKEITGGVFPMLIIKLFGPNVQGLKSFWDGLKDGYEQTTQS
jgi:hypothetical protein